MTERTELDPRPSGGGDDLPETVGAKERRKLQAQRVKNRSIWIGFSMMGLVGWSVAVPCLLGTALGIWIDAHHRGPYSWTLMLLVLGLLLGCYNAWYWVDRENEKIRKEHEANDDR